MLGTFHVFFSGLAGDELMGVFGNVTDTEVEVGRQRKEHQLVQWRRWAQWRREQHLEQQRRWDHQHRKRRWAQQLQSK